MSQTTGLANICFAKENRWRYKLCVLQMVLRAAGRVHVCASFVCATCRYSLCPARPFVSSCCHPCTLSFGYCWTLVGLKFALRQFAGDAKNKPHLVSKCRRVVFGLPTRAFTTYPVYAFIPALSFHSMPLTYPDLIISPTLNLHVCPLSSSAYYFYSTIIILVQ